MRARLRILAATSALVLIGGCSKPAAPLPPSPPVITITMSEYHFDYPKDIPRGRVVFRVVNAGHLMHKLTMAPLHKDYPPVAEQLKGMQRRSISTVAATAAQPPGATTSFAVDMGPQRYGIFCLIIEPNGKDHARSGMASEFRVA